MIGKLKFILFVSLVLITTLVSAKEYHVSVNGNNTNNGSSAKPFKTINFAAQLVRPGDVVTVHAGTYREWINPAHGGESDSKRIVYRAAEGEMVEIKGSELIKAWEKDKGSVWKVIIPNSFFGDYNPYKDTIHGDWFGDLLRIHHTGEVFLNGKSLFEMEKIAKVYHPIPNTKIKDTDGSTFTWYCESDTNNTIIWANFQNYDPNKEKVEISTRRTCFYPDQPGINYLTISGFHISQAATQWGAPTAEQIGMISTHWNKGWIIENNVISDSKCSGITLGKERSTGQNVWSANRSIDGAVHYIEVIFRTLNHGWNKENIGSHIVRNNEIFNCEQTGICGSMGAAFSVIENNHIHHIWTKRLFEGAEIGGIKFHGAIDTKIERNRIHDSGRGIWLDWMAQGARVSKNLLYNNTREDLFLEVVLGPTLVDNNIMLSPVGVSSQSQGVAFVHNLIAGQIGLWPEPLRYIPYHLPHSTSIAGLSPVLSGDDRYYNNIFIGQGTNAILTDTRYHYGLVGYNEAKLAVWISGNIYYNGATTSKDETNTIDDSGFNPEVKVIEVNNNGYLQFSLDETYYTHKNRLITTELLGKAKLPNQAFENSDGTPLKIDSDFQGNKRSESNPSAGPFEIAGEGIQYLKVW